MSIAIAMQTLEQSMEPFNAKMKIIVENDEKKKKHSEATKQGMEGWIAYKTIWLKKIDEQYPKDSFKTYNDKIKHIALMWKIRNKSIAIRQKEKLVNYSKQ